MSTFINDETIEKVLQGNDIVDTISQYVKLKRTGSNYVGLCPFHNEKTPSFTINPSKQFYHCFGCGEGGDVIDFIMKIENLSFPEAIKLLGDRSGISIGTNKKNIEKQKKKERYYEINRNAAIFFHKNLYETPYAIRYLKNRSIEGETIKKFGIGYALNEWHSLQSFLIKRGFNEKEIESVGLISKRKKGDGYYDKFRNRVMFPIMDIRNKIVGFGGRVIDNSMPKYLNSPDTMIFSKRNNLYGLNLANKYSKRERIVLVEGYMDVISLFNNGINYAVASLGTAFTNNQAKLLKRYRDNVYICYDSDEAGLRATYKALNILKKEDINAKVILLPKEKDPDDFIRQHGKDKFESMFNKALNYIDYVIFFNKRKYNLEILEEKVLFTQNMAKVLKEIKSSIELDAYINKISVETNISKEAIKNEILGKNVNVEKKGKDKYINLNIRDTKNSINPIRSVLEPAHLKAEKSILKLILEDKKIFEKVRTNIKPEDFVNLECREVAKILYYFYDEGKTIKKSTLLKILESKENIEIENIIEIFNQGIVPADSTNEIIEDLIRTINYSKLKMRRNKIVEKIYEIESKKDKNEEDVKILKELSLELLEIDKEMKLHS